MTGTDSRQNSHAMLARKIKRELSAGKSQLEVVNELVKKNWSQREAEQFVSSIRFGAVRTSLSPEELKELKKKIRHYFLWGIFASAIAAIAYFYPDDGGGAGKIKWGSLLVGLYHLGAGVYYLIRLRSEQELS